MKEKFKSGIYGLLIGDAIGVPYEFNAPDELPEGITAAFEIPSGHDRTYHIPLGTWSDDGAQALCLLNTLVENEGKLEISYFADSLIWWESKGFMTPDGVVFDIGNTTQEAIDNLKQGVSPEKAGPNNVKSNGNGALMRTLPLIYFFSGRELVEAACSQAKVTHGHVRSQVCCAIYCVYARYILEGKYKSLKEVTDEVAHYKSNNDAFLAEVNYVTEYKNPRYGSGYVVDTLISAVEAFESEKNYGDVVIKAIKYGYDTDTTACVAGGLAGIKYEIPEDLKKTLRGNKQVVEPLLEKL